MKNIVKGNNTNSNSTRASHSSHGSKRFVPSSLKFISSCLKTASSGVRSASASVAASLAGDTVEQKDQVLWASFDRIEASPSYSKRVLLLGYSNGFQVIDVDEASNVREVVSRRDDPVTFLQIQPLPAKSGGHDGFRMSHPILLVVACDESNSSGVNLSGKDGMLRDGYEEPHAGNLQISPRAVRFYSIKTHSYVHVLRFRSTVYMVRCSPQIVAVGLSAQIYCVDAVTLENKFSVLTYPIPQMGGQGMGGVNVGYGPMAVGPRWLAYASNNPLLSNSGRLSPQSLSPSPGVSPSTSPGNGNLVARYAMESGKQLATGLISLGDMGYKTLSRYYQDGSSSPVSPSSGWKAGRTAAHLTETDNSGMVVIKDFISRAVIAQFKAHASPISALCFDPSGTLLVTASVHGNNINIFRIIPSSSKNGSGAKSYDWNSSHAHLYKLHRGMTSAVIQDVCFSQYSQWVTIVSSHGTCHIFALSPFGGENVLQLQHSHVDGPTISPTVSLPWWSSPSFTKNHQVLSSSPPATVTLSVVSRIKDSNSGWLNTVSNAAACAVGKALISSGALAAVFHRSVPLVSAHGKSNALEYILAYTSSGHVVQYKLLPSLVGEPGEGSPGVGTGSSVHNQDEDLHVKAEAIQGWDVCRGANWPEREDNISGFFGERETAGLIMDASDCKDNDAVHKEFVKPQERSHLYLSNAEVRIGSGRILVWENSKISFRRMNPLAVVDQNLTANVGGEIAIEQVPVLEVEIQQRDLLPIFDHFRGVRMNRRDRDLYVDGLKEILPKHIVVSKLTSPISAENSQSGSTRISYPSIFDTEEENTNAGLQHLEPSLNKENRVSVSLKEHIMSASPVKDGNFMSNPLLLTSGSSTSDGRAIRKEVQSSNSGEGSNISSNHSDLSMNILDEGPTNDSPDFEQFFVEDSIKASALTKFRESAEVVTAAVGIENIEEHGDQGDDDDMLGGVFAFFEEG